MSYSDELIRAMVVRVMKDGKMNKFEACAFVAPMTGLSGLAVLAKFVTYGDDPVSQPENSE